MNAITGLVAGALLALMVITALARAQGTHERYALADLRKESTRLQRRAGALRVERSCLRAALAPTLDPYAPAVQPEIDA